MLRFLSEHARKQNWFAVVLEFLIVVGGVFMGLQAQEWNQRRTDRIKADAYLSRLSADFAVIVRDLRGCLSVYRDSVNATKLISRVVAGDVESESPRLRDPGRLSDALVRMTAGTTPAGRSATFIEMLSAGDLSILSDATLRDVLVAYDERAQNSREIWRSLRDELIAYQQPLYDNVELHVDLDQKRISSIRSFDLEAMAADPGFHRLLNVMAGNKGNTFELCQDQLRLAEKVQQSVTRNRSHDDS